MPGRGKRGKNSQLHEDVGRIWGLLQTAYQTLTGNDSWEEISFPNLTNGSKMKFKKDPKKRMNDGLEIIGSCLLNQGWVITEELIFPDEEGGLDSCLMLGFQMVIE